MQIGVVMGGVSIEKEISYLTGKHIIENLDKEKYEVLPIPINTKYELIDRVKCLQFAFIALHGSFGEDGKVQAILESMNVPYSGSGVLSSALCMDKNMSKKVFKNEKILTPKWDIVKENEDIDYKKIDETIGYPLIVKPNNGGSSIGINIVYKEEDLQKAIMEAFIYDKEIILEEYIKGKEIVCCMLKKRMLPILTINPKEEFFNYFSKYEDNGAEEKVANFSDDMHKNIEKICLKCWDVFKLKVYGTVDIIIRKNQAYVIEINTIPGMTKNSLFPKSAKAAGIQFGELLDEIIQDSMTK